MDKYGFFKVASAIPKVTVADCSKNIDEITRICHEAHTQGAELILFPELSVSGYTCADLFEQTLLLRNVEKAVEALAESSLNWGDMTVVVGAPVLVKSRLYNSAVVVQKGTVKGIVNKIFLPNYSEFYERRWFRPATPNLVEHTSYAGTENVAVAPHLIFCKGDARVYIELCEDVWTPIPPSSRAAMAGANVILNLSASNEVIGKHNYLVTLLKQQSARTQSAYIYSSAGYGESSTDLVFAGNAMVIENGAMLARAERFKTESQLVIADVDIERLESQRARTSTFTEGRTDDEYIEIRLDDDEPKAGRKFHRKVEQLPFIPNDDKTLNERCEEIINIQTAGLMQRLDFTHCKSLVVGVSGGLDSTLALLVAVKAFDRLSIPRSGIYGITMPGFGTTDRTFNNALTLLRRLGVTRKEISIKEAVLQHFSDIGQDPNAHDITYENSQARERTQILMDFANKVNGMVLGTGDLSELALGWATYNGDQMSMYGVNAGVPKTLVRYLVKWVADTDDDPELCDTLHDIVNTPISPELLPADNQGSIAQKTEDLVGPYELHDFFIYNVVRNNFAPDKVFFLAKKAFEGMYGEDVIRHWQQNFYRRFFSQQFKRSAMPDGPKVGNVSFSPRGDWRMPSDASSAMWLDCDID